MANLVSYEYHLGQAEAHLYQHLLLEGTIWLFCALFLGPNFYNTSYYPIKELLEASPDCIDERTNKWSKAKQKELLFVGLTVRSWLARTSQSFRLTPDSLL